MSRRVSDLNGPVFAVGTCLKKYASFSGTAPRSEFWWFFGFYVVVSLVTFFIPFGGALTLVFVIPLLAVSGRRLRDSGRSLKWLSLPVATWVFWNATIFILVAAVFGSLISGFGALPTIGLEWVLLAFVFIPLSVITFVFWLIQMAAPTLKASPKTP